MTQLLTVPEYEVDGVGNRQMVTETLRTLEIVEIGQAYQEANGFLTIEAENGIPTAGNSHEWISQTVQNDYAGNAYLRALPDIGQRDDSAEMNGSPRQSFAVQIENPADYTVWIRGMAPDAAGDSAHIGINASTSSAQTITGFTNEWSWSRQTMSSTQAALPLNDSGFYTLTLSMREDGLRIDRLLLITDTAYIPSSAGPVESGIKIITATASAGLISHTIQYDYDDLYRLTEALYTGDITATYQYDYDAVGNMTTYTDTHSTGSGQAGNTTSVSRSFDEANRMQNSIDSGSGELTTFTYDDNGNMIRQLAGVETTGYAYNQRNLLLTMTKQTGSDPIEQIAAYTYDGTGNRLRQTIYNSGSPAEIITYTNDIMGLTQVLVADDGIKQVYNLYGLDLIGQQASDASQQRLLLADGLGSVRQEMIGDNIEAITSYDPYGNLLTQTGATSSSPTTYGYTGEQTDNNGLLYLRARYYNPAQRTFQSRDPWSGNSMRPQSMNGWNYVNSNPINFTDPTGMIPFPEHCSHANHWLLYAQCVRDTYGVSVYPGDDEEYIRDYRPALLSTFYPGPLESLQAAPGCYYGTVPYRTSGYAIGINLSVGAIFAFNDSWGIEDVWDFATMKRAYFSYGAKSWREDERSYSKAQYFDPVWSTSVLNLSIVYSHNNIKGFRGWGKHSLKNDYEGDFSYTFGGFGGDPIGAGPVIGSLTFSGDYGIHGYGTYVGGGAGISIPIIDYGSGVTTYDMLEEWSQESFGNPGRKDEGGSHAVTSRIYNSITWSDKEPSHAQNLMRLYASINLYVQAFNGIQVDAYGE